MWMPTGFRTAGLIVGPSDLHGWSLIPTSELGPGGSVNESQSRAPCLRPPGLMKATTDDPSAQARCKVPWPAAQVLLPAAMGFIGPVLTPISQTWKPRLRKVKALA